MMGRIDALEARLKSFEEAVLSAKDEAEDAAEDAADGGVDEAEEGEKEEMARIGATISGVKKAASYIKKHATFPNIRAKIKKDGSIFEEEVNIQELVQQEIVKQFSALGTQVPPAPSVAVEKKEEPKAPTFFELVDGEVKGGKTRSQAVEFVVAKHPEAHMSYLESIGIYKK